MHRILITDGSNRSALAATRSLGRKGHTIYVCGERKKTLASSSCYCEEGLAVPDPLHQGEAYVASILKIVEERKIDVIFPMTEQTIYLLNPKRALLPSETLLACPQQDTMREVSDKYNLFSLAERLGLAVPHTWYLNSHKDLPGVISVIEPYPVVVKPSLSRITVKGGFLSGGVSYANSQTELEDLYHSNPALQYPSLIQEKIEGPGTGLFTLYDNNRHLALFSHKRLREKPPSGGVSVVCASVALDDEMIHAADKLLSAVGFKGVAMIEFKRDLRDGKAKLMEINGRFWGSLQLAIASGIDFPALYLDYLQEKSVVPLKHDYIKGHTLKWFFGTLDHLLIRLKNKDSAINLPAGSPSKKQATLDFLTLKSKNTSFDVADTKDIGPFIYEAVSYLQALWKKR